MLLNYIILLLLYWPFTKATLEDHVIDQLATASENNAASLTKDTDERTDTNSLSSSTEPDENIDYYENSNGFMPITTTTLRHHSNNSTSSGIQQDNLEKELYSSEARLFLNLRGPTINRRSFDTQDGQKEFEILKVNDQTPAVANYHEFYENLKQNMHNNAQQSMESARNVPYHRTGERIKQIESYLNYDMNQQRSNSNPYPLYYNQENSWDTQKKTAYEREKVQNNYYQHGAPDYDIFGESVTRQRPTSLPSINYDNFDSTKNNRNKLTLSSKQRASKPVVVASAGDHKANLQYGNQQLSSKLTTESYRNVENTPEDRYDRREDYSEENGDYYEITERPRRLHKSRRKPSYTDNSRKLPKEHRDSSSNDLDELKKLNSPTRVKSHRNKVKQNHWNNENQNQDGYESSEEESDRARPREQNRNVEKQQNAKENSNSWSQVAPNVEFSHSNAYEISQIDKPNLLVPINLNLVPVTNFDHTAAVGNGQGFDFTNVGVPNFVTSGAMVSTASPLISSSQPILMSHISPQNPTKNGQNIDNGNYAYSTAASDIIVGQNTYQNALQTVLLPQPIQNKYAPNLKTYYPSTVAPMLTVNPNIHSTQSSKLHTPQLNTVSQIFYPSSTLHPIIQTPGQSSANYNIVVNPHGLHGQNHQLPSQNNDHKNNNDYSNNNNNNNNNNSDNNENTPSASVTDKQSKQNTFTGSNGQFLASASFSVGRGAQSSNAQSNENKYYVPTNNVNNNNIYAGSQISSQVSRPQLQANIYSKTFIPAQVIPAFVQTPSGIAGVNVVNQNQQQQQHQLVNVGSNIFGNPWSQLHHMQQNQPTGYNNRVQYQNMYANRDNIGSTSNNNANTVNSIQNGVITRAQLPVVGVQTVEIQNPNIYIKPSPVDVSGMNQYQGTVLTTAIPIFSTAQNFLTPRPAVTSTTPESISIQSYVDSLTQIGAQNNPGNRLEQKVTDQNQYNDRPTYNPMNFVPSIEVVKNQALLNTKTPEQTLPSALTLVPAVQGGNFYKHSHSAQADLITKPKLSSDLEKYAEEMFKESIRTIYNTHKWNTDHRIKNYTTSSDGIDFERLKSDLERYRAAMTGSKYGKDLLEAHHSEPQVHTTDLGRAKRPGLSIATIDELFKNNFKMNSLSDSYSASSDGPDLSQVKKLNDYLTPPKVNSFLSKSPFIDSNKPGKKRPSKTRSHSRPLKSHGTRQTGLETAASNHIGYSHRRPHYNRNVHNEYRISKNYDNYPTFTTSASDMNISLDSKSDYLDINHPRTHNYLGLLMKNNKLPTGSSTSVLRDDDDYKQYFDNERRRMQTNRDGSLQSSPSTYVRQLH